MMKGGATSAWKNASEELPKQLPGTQQSCECLVYIGKGTHGYVLVAHYDYHLKYWTTGNFYEGKLNNVTHWRELPEGPEEG